MKFKPRKCQFFNHEIAFLGKLLKGNRVIISPDKLEAVKEWTIPQNSKQLLSFLVHISSFARLYADYTNWHMHGSLSGPTAIKSASKNGKTLQDMHHL